MFTTCCALLVAFLAASPALFGQARPAPAGLQPEWDARQDLAALATAVNRFEPLLDKLHPKEWTSKGAPQAYVDQYNQAQAELGYLLQSVAALEREPEKMSAALDTIFRMESLEAILGSLIQGVRKYQNPKTGDLMAGVIADNDSRRERLRQYVLDLVKDKEAQFKVMNEEAQRCRATVLRQPLPPAKSGKKTGQP
jgi:hypothetical protein